MHAHQDPAAHISQVAQGFRLAAVLLTAVKTGLFDALDAEEGSTLGEAADALGFDPRALEVVLLALAAHGFVEIRDGRYRTTSAFAPVLRRDGAQSQANILSHNCNLMARWTSLPEVLRQGRPVESPSMERKGEDLRNFICGMADISRRSSAEVAEALDLSDARRMLDLGGGPATSSIVFCRRCPQLHATVFDLPDVVRIAREEIDKADLADRIHTRAGNMLDGDYGGPYDLVYVSNIIHMLSPDQTAHVFQHAARATAPGGRIVVKDFFLDDSRTRPPEAALFSVNMLVGTQGGKSYTYSETQQLLRQAGFDDFAREPVASASALLIARRKA